jgi:hypothetical protein
VYDPANGDFPSHEDDGGYCAFDILRLHPYEHYRNLGNIHRSNRSEEVVLHCFPVVEEVVFLVEPFGAAG